MEKKKNSNNNPLRIILAIAVLLVLIGAGAYAAFVLSAGDGEASVDVGEVVQGVADAATGTTYVIDQEQSEARFYIDEVLRGEDVTVVGATNQIGGEVVVNTANPQASEVGEILINARTLTTDQNMRNNALRSFILLSSRDQYEFITFQPSALEGLPSDAIEAGATLTFQIVGDLTIVETTNEVTFDVSVTLNEDNSISGSATTTVLYPDFELTIPNVPAVASVEDEVTLEFDFVAVAAE